MIPYTPSTQQYIDVKPDGEDHIVASSLDGMLKDEGRAAKIETGIMFRLDSYSVIVLSLGVTAFVVTNVLAQQPKASMTPPLHPFSTIQSNGIGRLLQESMIWSDNQAHHGEGIAVAFRASFEMGRDASSQTTLSIFADARYVLWINGVYVDRGPSRFQPNGPQYDVIDVTPHLRSGQNCVAVLVIGQLSGGKIMRHRPGLTAVIQSGDKTICRTDDSWKCADRARFVKVSASWANLNTDVVDARVEDGDWTKPDYDDRAWHGCVKISGESWGPLTRSLIPRLREVEVPVKFGSALPAAFSAGEKVTFDTGRIVQAYPIVELEATAGTEIVIEPFGVRYIARAGRQSFFTIDTCGLSRGAIRVKSGQATIHAIKLIERLYPFDRIGSFESNDVLLNDLWKMCARSCEVLSEDSYVDCADRERVEWMDDTPPGFEMTQVAMAGPGADGKRVYSDPRLLAALIRRTALTLQPDGWVKAHTCSDRYDIHAKMEDRACDWVEGQRIYLDATGDDSIVRESWPAIVAQMDYFLIRRTERGLVRGRDWVVWNNPVGYLAGEGTTLNVFVQRALVDAAYLGHRIGQKDDAARFTKAADELGAAINSVLWDDTKGTYCAGYFTDQDAAENKAAKRKTGVRIENHLAASTLHANLFALDRGIVPASRRQRVVANLLEQAREHKDDHVMVWYYLIRQMYVLDQASLDRDVLEMFRSRWADMARDPWQCSWEGLGRGWGSKAHIYGMYPGYFLSAYVLGVRRDEPVSAKRIVIEPHLGDLTQATGIVVTEFGPVKANWNRDGHRLRFSCNIPSGVTAVLRLPATDDADAVQIDGETIRCERSGSRWVVTLESGSHSGEITRP